MAKMAEIAQDPRFATATPEQKKRLLAKADDASPGLIEQVKAALVKRPELRPYGGGEPVDPTNAVDMARETVSAPIRAGMTLAAGPEATGEAVADLGGEAGYPKTAATMGTIVQMAPDLLGAGKLLYELENSAAPIARMIRTKPRDLSPEYDALKEAAGVSGDLPSRRGYKARFPPHEPQGLGSRPPRAMAPGQTVPEVPPASYPKDINDFLNFAKGRIKTFGSRLSAQELNDYNDELGTWLSTNKKLKNTRTYAVAAKLAEEVAPLHEEAIPGWKDLDRVYKWAKRLHPEIGKAVMTAAKKVMPYFRWGIMKVP